MPTHSLTGTSPVRPSARRGHAPRVINRHFARHYAEMLVAMLLGMAVLGVPASMALAALGMSSSELHHDAPALMLFAMAVTMTVPMVGWMGYRGHGWRASTEMSASMFVPTFAVIALLGAGLVVDVGTLLVIEHVAMLLSMLVAMLMRGEEYSGHVHGRARPQWQTANRG
jgi:flagellar biosynthetic protein FliP